MKNKETEKKRRLLSTNSFFFKAYSSRNQEVGAGAGKSVWVAHTVAGTQLLESSVLSCKLCVSRKLK